MLLGEGDTQCLTLQFLWVASLLLRRDTAHAQVLQFVPVLLWRWESFEPTSLCINETPRVREQRDLPIVTGASKVELGLEPRYLISMAMSSSDVPVGNEHQRAQRGRRVADGKDGGRIPAQELSGE